MKFSRSLVWASSNRAHALLARRCQTIARNSPGQAQGQICSTGRMTATASTSNDIITGLVCRCGF